MNTTKDKGAPSHGTPSKTPRFHFNSAHAQRQRLLAYMRQFFQIDTLTARRDLDILMPAARVLELRRRGYQIETVWVNRPTDCGKIHRVGLYVLKPEVNHAHP
ncbi:MAG: helix-turn-helix domain-containing protein [Gallionella sp.]|nr:helix-turn-helix domain-containing protein [Gallionella sp.]MDD4946571.1 helix-turn-helix domain-containing protein [Gallionella sp.]